MPKEDFFYRFISLERKDLDPDKRTFPVSFSSEAPVRRWFGNEILWHDAEAVDLSRLQGMGTALLNHNANIIVGPVSDVRIERKKGRATITFDDDDDGNKALKKVQSGSLRGVSVGYQVLKFKEIQEGETWRGFEGPAYVATRWMPIEISLTPIPADGTVGIGRDMTRSLDGIEIEQSQFQTTKEEPQMDEKQIRELVMSTVASALKEAVPEITNQVRTVMAEANKPRLQIPVETARDLIGRASAISETAKCRITDLIFDGKTEIEVLREINDLHVGSTDASDKGQNGPDGTGIPGKTNGTARDFSKLTDDDWARGFTDPQPIILD